jgi:transposase-like protein
MVQQAKMEAAVPAAAERVRDFRSEVVDPEVVEEAKRRRFSAPYKLKILEEVDRHPGRSSAILRREGLYSSHLSAWRKQREDGALKALGKKRGPQGKSAEQLQLEELQREKARLERELFKAHAIIDAEDKLAEILGVDLPKITDPDPDTSE